MGLNINDYTKEELLYEFAEEQGIDVNKVDEFLNDFVVQTIVDYKWEQAETIVGISEVPSMLKDRTLSIVDMHGVSVGEGKKINIDVVLDLLLSYVQTIVDIDTDDEEEKYLRVNFKGFPKNRIRDEKSFNDLKEAISYILDNDIRGIIV